MRNKKTLDTSVAIQCFDLFGGTSHIPAKKALEDSLSVQKKNAATVEKETVAVESMETSDSAPSKTYIPEPIYTEKGEEVPLIEIRSSTVIMISDIHFGWNVSSEEWQENISSYFTNWFIPFLREQLKKTPDAVLCCLGDVYHDRKSIDIDVNELCINTFEKIAGIIPVYIINGNHDLAKKTNRGNSSLRSLSNIKNLTLIRVPTLLVFTEKNTNHICSIGAVPYLGDCNDENQWITRFSGSAEYIFAHTEISGLKMDNGMKIVGAVEPERFTGKRIFSGHIHRRQETKKVVYVGSPYHLSMGDVGDTKGIYVLDLKSGKLDFTENKFSPVFKKITLDSFMTMPTEIRLKEMKNCYAEIVSDGKPSEKYKMGDVYDLLNSCGARRTQLKENRKKKESQDNPEDDSMHTEKPLQQIINDSIEAIDGISEEKKESLKKKSDEYFSAAQARLDTTEERAI